VFALLYIDLLRRRREIALLSAVGFGRGEIFATFVLQALITSLVAAVAGALVGAGAIAWFTGHPLFESEAFVVRPLPSLGCFARPMGVVVATAAVASAIPAWFAARRPVALVLRSLE
jgi:putative ABC transport system permease protein